MKFIAIWVAVKVRHLPDCFLSMVVVVAEWAGWSFSLHDD
jgi:hypothetical protein